jgi:hypothetical protein
MRLYFFHHAEGRMIGCYFRHVVEISFKTGQIMFPPNPRQLLIIHNTG